MKIALLGETRLPVLPFGGGGLGRATWEIGTDLMDLGHQVTLFAPPNSQFRGPVSQHMAFGEYDVYLDYSHDHQLSKRGFQKVLNLIGDRECDYCPPCAVVETEYMQRNYPGAMIAPQGCMVDEIPFSDKRGDYLLFMGANVAHKQPDLAREVAQKAGKEIRFIGPGFAHVPEVEKWRILGEAAGLLCPYTIDASPRAPLEAAACGTPTLCLAGDGTQEHVECNVSGFVCVHPDEMVERVKDLGNLDPAKMREWVKATHDNKVTIREIERLLQEVASGKVW